MPSLPRIRPRRVAAPAAPPEHKGFGSSTAFRAILASSVALVVAMLGFFRYERRL